MDPNSAPPALPLASGVVLAFEVASVAVFVGAVAAAVAVVEEVWVSVVESVDV